MKMDDFEDNEMISDDPEKDGFDDIEQSLNDGKKKKKKKKKGDSGNKKGKSWILLIVLLIVCLVAAGIAIWQITHIQLQYKAAEDEYEDLLEYVYEDIDEDDTEDADTESEDEDEEEEEDDTEVVERVAISLLKQQNADTAGWIEIPGTTISYPLMHTTDNSYYLTHTFSGKVNSSGCIFIETLNSADMSDVHTIIYGHNMKNGAMFAALKNYSSASYLVAHPTIYIDLEDGTHAYQIFSVHSASSDDLSFTIGFAHDDEYEEFLAYLKESSDYDTGVTVSVEDDIITLSTCTNSGEDRYLVHAKKLY